MARTPVQRPRGTQDILPADQPYWRLMQQAAERLAGRYGYRKIDTPIFEATELFSRSSGDASDIVVKEMYTFTDRGDRSLTLRPEGTAPIVRAYFEGGLAEEPQPVRLFYMGPYFRYGRPQKGRLRELHQFGVEVIGDDDPGLDVEAIHLSLSWFKELGITGIGLQLNSIGDEVCRPAYLELLRDYYRPLLPQLCADDQVRFERNPLRMLDCNVPADQRFKADAPRIVDHLDAACAAAFESVKAGLRALGITFVLNPALVRGLDYYTRTVFEGWHESLGGAQNALVGGGRYDGLAAELGFRSTPGMGFAIGLDRTAIVLKQGRPYERDGLDVYAVSVKPGDRGQVLELASTLRQHGFGVIVDSSDARLDAKLRKADRRGARLALIVGPDERARGEAILRDMRGKDQVRVGYGELAAAVGKTLGGRA
jgi:histidyl-tRNA synthetase